MIQGFESVTFQINISLLYLKVFTLCLFNSEILLLEALLIYFSLTFLCMFSQISIKMIQIRRVKCNEFKSLTSGPEIRISHSSFNESNENAIKQMVSRLVRRETLVPFLYAVLSLFL